MEWYHVDEFKAADSIVLPHARSQLVIGELSNSPHALPRKIGATLPNTPHSVDFGGISTIS